METDDPVDVLVAHIRQRDVISLKEGQAGIVVLKVQGIPHARRHLVDEAEDTFVPAGAVLAHEAVFKGEPQILSAAVDFKLPLFPILLSHEKRKFLALGHVFIVKNVFDFVPVYGKKKIAGLQLQLFPDGAWRHGRDLMAGIFQWFFPSLFVVFLYILYQSGPVL